MKNQDTDMEDRGRDLLGAGIDMGDEKGATDEVEWDMEKWV